MKINGKISILINHDETIIELYDDDASITFATVTLTPEQLSSALSRLAHTKCDIEVAGLSLVGKKMEFREAEFELPDSPLTMKDSELKELCQSMLDEWDDGWICDGYFGSQNSFFRVGNKRFARCTVRRWVNIEK